MAFVLCSSRLLDFRTTESSAELAGDHFTVKLTGSQAVIEIANMKTKFGIDVLVNPKEYSKKKISIVIE